MIGIGSFRQAIRSITVSHAIPQLVAMLLAFTVICFGFSAAIGPPLRTLAMVCGGSATLVALFLVLFGALARPNLLRSERYLVENRVIDLLADAETDAALRVSLTNALSRPQLGREASIGRRESDTTAASDETS